jgi:hypothetical protein
MLRDREKIVKSIYNIQATPGETLSANLIDTLDRTINVLHQSLYLLYGRTLRGNFFAGNDFIKE